MITPRLHSGCPARRRGFVLETSYAALATPDWRYCYTDYPALPLQYSGGERNNSGELCCGSSLPPGPTVPTGSFTRLMAAPAFYLGFGAAGDTAPPGRITDLSILSRAGTATRASLNTTMEVGLNHVQVLSLVLSRVERATFNIQLVSQSVTKSVSDQVEPAGQQNSSGAVGIMLPSPGAAAGCSAAVLPPEPQNSGTPTLY